MTESNDAAIAEAQKKEFDLGDYLQSPGALLTARGLKVNSVRIGGSVLGTGEEPQEERERYYSLVIEGDIFSQRSYYSCGRPVSGDQYGSGLDVSLREDVESAIATLSDELGSKKSCPRSWNPHVTREIKELAIAKPQAIQYCVTVRTVESLRGVLVVTNLADDPLFEALREAGFSYIRNGNDDHVFILNPVPCLNFEKIAKILVDALRLYYGAGQTTICDVREEFST